MNRRDFMKAAALIPAVLNAAPVASSVAGLYLGPIESHWPGTLIAHAPTGGSFTISYNGKRSAPLAWNCSERQYADAYAELMAEEPPKLRRTKAIVWTFD